MHRKSCIFTVGTTFAEWPPKKADLVYSFFNSRIKVYYFPRFLNDSSNQHPKVVTARDLGNTKSFKPRLYSMSLNYAHWEYFINFCIEQGVEFGGLHNLIQLLSQLYFLYCAAFLMFLYASPRNLIRNSNKDYITQTCQKSINHINKTVREKQ